MASFVWSYGFLSSPANEGPHNHEVLGGGGGEVLEWWGKVVGELSKTWKILDLFGLNFSS